MWKRAIHWRIGIVVAGAIVTIMWRMSLGEPMTVILIDFGIKPELLVGTEVVIDGEVVGTLKRMGSRTQTGFEVPDGDHVVELRNREIPGRQRRVTTGFGGGRVMLIVDISSGHENGRDVTYLDFL